MPRTISKDEFILRSVLAYVIVPWIPVVIAILAIVIFESPSDRGYRLDIWAGKTIAFMGYAVEIVFATPLIYRAIKSNKTSAKQFVLIGWQVTTIPLLFVAFASLLLGIALGNHHGKDPLIIVRILGYGLLPTIILSVFGMVEGYCYWLIARPDKIDPLSPPD